MKAINILSLKKELFIFLLTLTVLISTFYFYNMSNAHLCEHPGYANATNLFWEIEQTEANVWWIKFNNIRTMYEVTSSSVPNDDNVQSFLFKEKHPFWPTYPPTYNIGPRGIPIQRTIVSDNLHEAVKTHFNSIQRGEFHACYINYMNDNSHGRGIRSPLDQFIIRDFISIDAPLFANMHLSLTNIGLYLTVAAFMASALNFLATNYNKVIANKWSISQESIYATIHSIVVNQINGKDGQKYYPFIYSLFILILTSNLIGMIPYSFASTSHFILTFFISFTIVFGSTILGFFLHKLVFFSLFVPSGCPLGLLPLLVLIEFISFLARNVSLGLRLAANILSGHMLLNILSEFTYNIMDTNIVYFFLGIVPLMFIVAFSALELGIAFIQAQVFVVLSSSYIKDSLELH